VHRGALLYSLPIGTNFTEIDYYALESFDYTISPTKSWNYAIKVWSIVAACVHHRQLDLGLA
jgi:hypothetical protein